MGIKFHCPNGHKLNVKAFLAGKRGICPKCGVSVDIPLQSEPKPSAVAAAGQQNGPTSPSYHAASQPLVAGANQPVGAATGALSDPIAEAPAAVWYLRPAAGGEYGPATGEVIRTWLAEGRVTADSWVWRDGWPEWRLAGATFPQFVAAQQRPNLTIPPPTVQSPPANSDWSAAPAPAADDFTLAPQEWADNSSSDIIMDEEEGALLTPVRHSGLRGNSRHTMIIFTAVLIASAVILVGVLAYLMLRPAPAPPVEPKPPATTSPLAGA